MVLPGQVFDMLTDQVPDLAQRRCTLALPVRHLSPRMRRMRLWEFLGRLQTHVRGTLQL